jgi:CRISPR-associated Csx2 family protein
MSKTILISFLGTGAVDDKRQYRTAKYAIDEKQYESSFVASVIAEHFDVPNQIIIGTAKSMWEELYRYYSEKNSAGLDEDFYLNLSTLIDYSDHKTDLETYQVDFKVIEKAIGGNSKCILIPYGLNQNEQLDIFRRISKTFDETIENQDELILDITHSFRSLPLFSTSVINYLNDVKSKNAKITKVLYGMLDAMREFENVAPIIDITSTIEINQWSKAAYSFKEYGKGYLLADLLGGKEADMLRIFSDSVGINYLSEIKTRLTNFKNLAESEIENEFAKIVLPQVLNALVDKLQKAGNTHHHFQFELAKWHFEKKNYGAAFIVFVECIISYVCDLEKLDWKQFDDREKAKICINKYSDIFKIYYKANLSRKNIAHNLSKRPDSMAKDIELLSTKISEFEKIILSKR